MLVAAQLGSRVSVILISIR